MAKNGVGRTCLAGVAECSLTNVARVAVTNSNRYGTPKVVKLPDRGKILLTEGGPVALINANCYRNVSIMNLC